MPVVTAASSPIDLEGKKGGYNREGGAKLRLEYNRMFDNKNNQRRAWSEEQDRALKGLYQSLRINKWSLIAEQLEREYGFPGRTGKQCRQRYNNHLDPALSRQEWSGQEEKKLYKLHDELGNKWAVISQKLCTNRTDNTVKNHFYSRLRKSLRKINKVIQEKYKKEVREIQTKVLYKIIEASEEKFKPEPMCDQEVSAYSCELKNKILLFSHEDEEISDEAVRALIQEVVDFNKRYKRKPKKLRKIGSLEYIEGENCEEQPEPELKITKQSFFNQKQELPRLFVGSFSSKNITKFQKQSQLDDDYDDDINYLQVQTQKQKIISPIILTAHQPSPQEKPCKLQSKRNNGNGEQILQALGLLQDDLSMPHPIFLRKNSSMMSSEHSQDPQEFKFFDDSSAEMRIMSTPILTSIKRQSMEDHLFH